MQYRKSAQIFEVSANNSLYAQHDFWEATMHAFWLSLKERVSFIVRKFFAVLLLCIISSPVSAQIDTLNSSGVQPPIIDVHIHGDEPSWSVGPLCPNTPRWSASDPATKEATFGGVATECSNFLMPAKSGKYVEKVAEEMRRLNVTGVVIADEETIKKWKRLLPGKIIPATSFQTGDYVRSIDEVRRDFEANGFKVMGEIALQYQGKSPSAPEYDAYFSLAEELDIPVAIHMGTGGAGRANINAPNFRASMGDPFLLEDMLARHPKLRVYIMHAGYPMIDNLLALLGANSHVSVDIAGLIWSYPLVEVNAYIDRIVKAGFADRIMFGSDQTTWPGLLSYSVSLIESADYLSSEQKRDILYNNAARFFRIEEPGHAGP